MEKNNQYTNIYDAIFFYLWDITTGGATSKRQTYKGARLYGKFLLSEIERYTEVQKSGEHAIERNGLVTPMSIIKAWTYNILEDCHDARVAPPLELCHAIYALMDCSHLSDQRGKPDAKEAYFKLRKKNPRIGIREAARNVGVNPSTILSWNKQEGINQQAGTQTNSDFDTDEYKRIRKLTNVNEFYPIRYKLLRKK